MRWLLLLLALTACTTPRTTLLNDKTGQYAMCGGDLSSSLLGGAIGYHIQKGTDEECVTNLSGRGFRVVQ